MKTKILEISQLSLLGKTKKEVLAILGDGFNFYPDNVWTYELGKNWLGKKSVLVVSFKDDILKSKVIKTTYRKCIQF